MNCTNCGIKISPTLARQQEGEEDLCRGCYLTEKARLNQERITKRLIAAGDILGIDVLDSVILGDGFYSFREEKCGLWVDK